MKQGLRPLAERRRTRTIRAAHRLRESAQTAKMVAETVREDAKAVVMRCSDTLNHKVHTP